MSIPSSPILDFEKAHQVALAENPESKDGFEMWRDLERQAQAAVSPLLAEIEALKAGQIVVDGMLQAAEAEAQKLREALEAYADRLDRECDTLLPNMAGERARSWRQAVSREIRALGGS